MTPPEPIGKAESSAQWRRSPKRRSGRKPPVLPEGPDLEDSGEIQDPNKEKALDLKRVI